MSPRAMTRADIVPPEPNVWCQASEPAVQFQPRLRERGTSSPPCSLPCTPNLGGSGSPVEAERKIELIDALSETGLKKIQVASYVNPKKVPGWADADEVVKGFRRHDGVAYHALWLNEKGLTRALDATGGNATEAARVLDLDPRRLQRLLKKSSGS